MDRGSRSRGAFVHELPAGKTPQIERLDKVRCLARPVTWFFIGTVLALLGQRKDHVTGRSSTVPVFSVIIYGISVIAIAMGTVLWLSVWDIGVPLGQALYVVGLMVLLAFAAIEFLFFIALMSRKGSKV